MFEQLFQRLPDLRDHRRAGHPAVGFIHGIKRMPCEVRTGPVDVRRNDGSVRRMTTVEPFDPGFGPLVDTTVRSRRGTSGRGTPRGRSGRRSSKRNSGPRRRTSASSSRCGTSRAGGPKPRSSPSALGGFDHVYASNLTFADGVHAGNAILSRWPILRSEVRSLPREAPNGSPRRRRRGATLRVRRDRRATRPDPGVLRTPLLARGPRRDPPGAGTRDLPSSPATRDHAGSRRSSAAT